MEKEIMEIIKSIIMWSFLGITILTIYITALWFFTVNFIKAIIIWIMPVENNTENEINKKILEDELPPLKYSGNKKEI